MSARYYYIIACLVVFSTFLDWLRWRGIRAEMRRLFGALIAKMSK